jgi:radical SAM superfamily enzyme YgiQ (UPF0313 family)
VRVPADRLLRTGRLRGRKAQEHGNTVKPSGRTPRPGAGEVGAVRKSRRGRTTVALVYPNRYHVGMSNLGLHSVYALLNRREEVVCERAFLPENDRPGRLTTIESNRPVAECDLIAFSISFESDYLNVLQLLERAGLPLPSAARDERHPLVAAGGVACFLNPEPIARFIDLFLIGEAEAILPGLLAHFRPGAERRELLLSLAREVPGAYAPGLYETEYTPEGTIAAFRPTLAGLPARITRPLVRELSGTATCSAVVTPDTVFGRAFLVEVGRGCPHGCRFCSAGFVYRPPRFRPAGELAATMREGLATTDQIGLVGAAVSDLPGVAALCGQFADGGARISFSSIRADALGPELARTLRQSGVKTATIAPEAGSERLRRVINKGITESDVLAAAETLVAHGIPNIKLYFMAGLPTETDADISAIAELVKRIKHVFLKVSRTRRAIGTITVGVSCFVPKPFTPFQWAAMEEVPHLKAKLRRVKNELSRVANVRVHADVPRWAYVQALLSRGDRRTADILARVHTLQGNWPQALKRLPLNADFYVHRERALDEVLPWDFIDHGVSREFLKEEYRRALEGRPGPVCPGGGGCRLCGACTGEEPV